MWPVQDEHVYMTVGLVLPDGNDALSVLQVIPKWPVLLQRLQKKVTSVRHKVESNSTWFLGSVSGSANEDEWDVNPPMNGTTVKFKIDTGADIIVMS